MQKPIYLDYNSTTPTDPEVVQAMTPYFLEHFGNPSNMLHSYGWTADNAVKQAQQKVSEFIHCKPSEVVWTAGATEGNNAVLFGLIRKIKLSEGPNAKIHFITSNAEHWSVLSSMAAAEIFEGVSVTRLPINSSGVVSPEQILESIRPETRLVSLIWVNNEIGSINPVQQISKICQDKEIYFHTDATQAIGKIDVDLRKSFIHFLTFSSHKFYGPKGIGGLIIRSQNPVVEIEPFIVGGGQQNNRRSGTLNVPGIVGTGKAIELLMKESSEEKDRLRNLSQKFYESLKTDLPEIKLNGPGFNEKNLDSEWLRSPMNISLQMPLSIDLVINKLSSIAFSQGSACQSGETTGSHVLQALGLSFEQSLRTVRFSIGRWTTENELNKAALVLTQVFKNT